MTLIALLQFKLYQSVIDDVVNGMREAFLDEGVDEQVLQELRILWESKLISTKAVDSTADAPTGQGATATGGGSTASTTPSIFYIFCCIFLLHLILLVKQL